MKKQSINSIAQFAIIIIIIGILAVWGKVVAQEVQKTEPVSAGCNQWNSCKEMWLKDKKAPEETYRWRKVTIREVSVFGGAFAKGYVNNDILFPVHIVPNLDKLGIVAFRQQLKEGAVVDIIGKCAGVTENNEVFIKADEVNLYE